MKQEEGAPLLTMKQKQRFLYLMLGFSLSWVLLAALPYPSVLARTGTGTTIAASAAAFMNTSTVVARATAGVSLLQELKAAVPSRRWLKAAEQKDDSSSTGVGNGNGNGRTSAQVPRVQFVFTMGLHGDGRLHDFLGKVVSQSPAMKRLVELGIAPGQLVELHRLLYQTTKTTTQGPNNKLMSPGLWNAHCDVDVTKASAAELHEQVVALLKDIKETVTDAYTSGKVVVENPSHPRSYVIPIPVNTVNMGMADLYDDDDDDSAQKKMIEDRFGRAAYPTEFKNQSCHRLDFASLDLWYATCQEAKVDCRHLFAHRRPLFELKNAFSLLMSTSSSRQQGRSSDTAPFQFHLAVIHHYNTMLHIIADEMFQFGPRNIGCLDTSASNWKGLWLELWGFSREDSILDSLLLADEDKALLFPRQDILRKDLFTVIPATTAPYVESFLQLHQNAANACVETLEQVHAFIKDKRQREGGGDGT